MRGILFTEYLDFVSTLGEEATIEEALASLNGQITGAYTSVGNYSFNEFATIHVRLSEKLDKDSNELARQFGHWLLGRFRTLFPIYFEGVESGLNFLQQVGEHIHEEVKKLYPDASPPDIILQQLTPERYQLTYRSHRPLSAVAHGLTEACLEYFGDPYRIVDEESTNGITVFILEKR